MSHEDRIDSIESAGQGIRLESFGGWEVKVGPDAIVGPESNLEGFLTDTMNHYAAVYRAQPGMENAALDLYGIPSPIIRVDMPHVAGEVGPDQGIFEVEGRPAGLGMTSMLFPELQPVFGGVIEQIQGSTGKKVAVKMLPYSNAAKHDTEGEKRIFAELMGIPFIESGKETTPDPDTLYFVYGDSDERGDDVVAYEKQSLFPVRDDGHKGYLEAMGRARTPTPELIESHLNTGKPFVVKPKQGMWAQELYAYTGPGKEGKLEGRSTATKIRELYEGIPGDQALENFLMQPFHRPGMMSFPDGQDRFAMARVFGVYNLQTRQYEVAGGVYVARKNVRLHGTSDAIQGRLKLAS